MVVSVGNHTRAICIRRDCRDGPDRLISGRSLTAPRARLTAARLTGRNRERDGAPIVPIIAGAVVCKYEEHAVGGRPMFALNADRKRLCRIVLSRHHVVRHDAPHQTEIAAIVEDPRRMPGRIEQLGRVAICRAWDDRVHPHADRLKSKQRTCCWRSLLMPAVLINHANGNQTETT